MPTAKPTVNLKPRPVALDDLFKMEFLQGGQIAPDGSAVVYAVSRSDGEKDFAGLWLTTIDADTTQGGAARPLTSGQFNDSNPRWSPDGRQIAFLRAAGGPPQVFVMDRAGGEPRQITHLSNGVATGPAWSPDGSQIAFSALPADPPLDLSKPYRVTRRVYRFDAIGYTDRARQDIYVIPADGGEPKRLTRDGYMNINPQWSPDGRELLYTAMMAPDAPRFLPGLRTVTLEGRKRDLVYRWGTSGQGVWLPDGKRVAFVGQPHGQLMGTKNDLYVIDTAGEAAGALPENRTASLLVGVGGGLQGDIPAGSVFAPNLTIASDGTAAYINVMERGLVSIYRIALTGPESCEPIAGGESRSVMLLHSSARHVLYAGTTLHDPTQLYRCDTEGADEKPLTALNAELNGRLLQPKVERLCFPSADGTEIEGWIMLPTVGQAPYPTILYIHGGPWGAWGHIYSFDFQMLAGAGYAVLFINHRGSTGYGDAFATAIQADWGNLDYQDHMAGLDYAIAQGYSDPDRLGVCGLSAGGYGTCWMIGHTDRFKAAVPENPVTNLSTIYGVGDIGEVMIRFMGGLPHEVPENYRRCSPISYAHQCRTPTLLIQGEMDFRCPAEQSEQFYAVLKDNGCTVEMLRLPNSPHAGTIFGPPVLRRAQNEALLGWMNQHVLGKQA